MTLLTLNEVKELVSLKAESNGTSLVTLFIPAATIKQLKLDIS